MCLKRDNTKSQNTKQKIYKKNQEPKLQRGIPHAERRRRPPQMKKERNSLRYLSSATTKNEA